MPRGGQRGTEVRVTLRGERLADAEALLFDGPGLEARDVEVKDARTVRLTIAIAPDCTPGEHGLRLRCRSGLSELHTFWVGTLKAAAEDEPNDARRAQRVELEVTLEGALGDEDEDAFAFEGRAGQRVAAEVEAMRLGGPIVDPELALLDASGATLAACDDAPLLGQDALLVAVLPADGTYRLVVREATRRGGDRWRYRLHLGTFPRPLAARPLGGRPDEALALELAGDVGGCTSASWTAPARPGPDGLAWLWPARDGALAPSPLPLRVADLASAFEVEPAERTRNDRDARRAATEVELPVALHGLLDAPGDVDWFRFTGTKGERVRLRAFGRALGSAADLALDLYRGGGRSVASGDDTGGRLDPDVTATLPEDGPYELRVRDMLERGGPGYHYRIEVAPVTSSLSLDLQTYGRNAQTRNAIAVPRGNRMAVLVRVERDGATGPVDLDLSDLPAGVAWLSTACAQGAAGVPLIVEAAPDAPLAATFAHLDGRCVGAPEFGGGLRQRVPLTFGQPNDAVYWARAQDRLALAVVEPAPFRLRVIEPKAPLVRDGALDVEVAVERERGFEGKVVVSMLIDPAGVASREVEVPGNKDRAVLPLTANGQAALGRWPLVAVARADRGGDVWVSSELHALDVAAPFVTLELPRVAGAQGATLELGGPLVVARPFEGEATARLIGLPGKCEAPTLKVTAATRELRFPIRIGADARPGRHRNVQVELVVLHLGERVVHRLAKTELRVDPPTTAEVAPVTSLPPGTSRLDQLRAEHAARRSREGVTGDEKSARVRKTSAPSAKCQVEFSSSRPVVRRARGDFSLAPARSVAP